MFATRSYVFAAFASLFVFACTGTDATNIPNAPASDPVANVVNDEDIDAPAKTTPPSTQPDAPPVVVTTPSSIAKHCSAPTGRTMDLCIENVEGRVGDVVDLEIHLLGTSTCFEAQEMFGRIDAKKTQFEIQNVADVDNCRTRRYDTALADPTTEEIVFAAFGANTSVGCTAHLPKGMKDAIKIKILPGTPPGDYTLSFTSAGVATDDAACAMQSTGISGVIRVLP